jgi:hypothetical protein
LRKFLKSEINDALSPIYPFDIRCISDSGIIASVGRPRQ